jgi:cytochrome b561
MGTMSEQINLAARPQVAPASRAGRFDQTSIALHWLTAVVVAAQLTMGLILSHGGDEIAGLLTAHRSLGIAIWIIVAARLVWRHGFAHLPPFPASMPKLQQRLAKLNEYALYALLLIQPITGLANTLFHGRPFALFAWRVPALITHDAGVFHAFRLVHKFGAWGLLVLVGLHSAAALFHALFLRDGVFQRMLPWTALPIEQTRSAAVSGMDREPASKDSCVTSAG